jgi:CubicO group peptidase (beta-lactamase class C family)
MFIIAIIYYFVVHYNYLRSTRTILRSVSGRRGSGCNPSNFFQLWSAADGPYNRQNPMTRRILHSIWLTVVMMAALRSPAAGQETRTWSGTLDAGGIKLRLELDITENSRQGVLRSLDQNNATLNVTQVRQNALTLSFSVPQVGASFQGTLSPGSRTAKGTFHQGGMQLPLTLSVQAAPAAQQDAGALNAVSRASLEKLDDLVESFVKDDEIVGGELLVISNGRSVLHKAYGWRDREASIPMEVGSVFCVRSMTKPVIGTAILMLVEENKLKLQDTVATYLESFDVEGSREITVAHLLTHTSGLPMSLLLGKDLKELDGIREVAELGAGHELEFVPGSDFNYSDHGTDTLTALIEVASGMPAADFVRTRVLEPLEMHETTCVMSADHSLRGKSCSKYVGARGKWTSFWTPKDPPLFPFFLGSQGLYSTLEDYSRFLALWQHGGRVGTQRLLGPQYVQKALTPSPQPFPGSTGLPGVTADYGCLMQLWMSEGGSEKQGQNELVAFGHSGSDGTWAWVFPKQNATVLYFTQSRGNFTGLQVEAALGELFLGVPFDPSTKPAPPLEQYLGYYSEGDNNRYQAVIRDGDSLALETPGRRIRELEYAGGDSWTFKIKPDTAVVFDRSDDGQVSGFHIDDHQEYRFNPAANLPGVDDVVASVIEAHQINRLKTLGPVRLSGNLSMEKLGLKGESATVLSWPDRFREDTTLGGQSEEIAFDGKNVWYASTFKPAAMMTGSQAEHVRRASYLVRFGDWRQHYRTLTVIQRLKSDEHDWIVVRAGDTSELATTFYVDAESGRVMREERIAQMDGLGQIGQSTSFTDYREVSGMVLPFTSRIEIAHSMIGAITATVEDVELGIRFNEDRFRLTPRSGN